jgi:hypothetical protein
MIDKKDLSSEAAQRCVKVLDSCERAMRYYRTISRERSCQRRGNDGDASGINEKDASCTPRDCRSERHPLCYCRLLTKHTEFFYEEDIPIIASTFADWCMCGIRERKSRRAATRDVNGCSAAGSRSAAQHDGRCAAKQPAAGSRYDHRCSALAKVHAIAFHKLIRAVTLPFWPP